MDDSENKDTESAIQFDGTRSIAELRKHPSVPMIAAGKKSIKDIGARLRQIAGLKPGQASIRTPEMIAEILERLQTGETLISVLCDDHMPATSTLWNWRDADAELDAAVRRAQAQGQHTLRDATLDIAQGGPLSSGDRARDNLIIQTIEANISQRNQSDFGKKVQVDSRSINVTINRDDCDW